MDSAAALKCNFFGLEFSLAIHLEKGSVRWRGPGMRMYKVVYSGREHTV